MISSLVYCRSSLIETTHSLIFCKILLGALPEALLVNKFLANCCVIVLAPPPFPNLEMALANPLKSIPECSKKRSSSVAIKAFTKFSGRSLN